jgi:hypothetical protein
MTAGADDLACNCHLDLAAAWTWLRRCAEDVEHSRQGILDIGATVEHQEES